MSILRIFKVTDSRWKKSSWATSSICLCHRISSTVAFSQMIQKLLPQLQHPLFPPPSSSSSGPATHQSQPFLLVESLRRCQFKGQNMSPLVPCWKAGPTLPSYGPAPQCSGRSAPGPPLPFPARSPLWGFGCVGWDGKPSCSRHSSPVGCSSLPFSSAEWR